ncbi:uncharacterized protein LOC129220136 [Uloborus diversus]|uniref:uncharacterized protein LOC129220136 n=1 Tax=Uloborus diversus TaxID=327109 RepID=UPI00240989E3|nr:uncharacterized protein LOC129220136 [Uloborus diversus]XP_054710461.1 uncharacterized protein LOC129220136 [Uloborus diversus]
MMKWKVVKNPRSASADRSLECLKTEAPTSPQTDSNNNSEQDVITSKENNKQGHQDRKPSKVASDCINLKSFLGLSRQRSESNLSCLGLISTEPRRSRSEVRGSSCDRLTIGYHTTPLKSVENRNFADTEKGFKLENNSKTRCSSPPRKSSCWLRGRKRERETKGNADGLGKTVVTGSNKKLGSKSKTCSSSSVTIVDGSDNKEKTKVCSSNNIRRSKFGKKLFDGEVIVEDVIYSDIDHENSRTPLLDDNKRETFKESNKVIRKKGQAPKPQITTSLFKEDGSAAITALNGKKTDQVNRELKTSPCSKPPRKSLTFNGRNQDKKTETTNAQTVRYNNFRNSDKSFCTDQSQANNHLIAIAEVHKNSQNGGIYKSVDTSANNTSDTLEKDLQAKLNYSSCDNEEFFSEKEKIDELRRESAPFYIDTPDYSTLESEVGDNSHAALNLNKCTPNVRDHCEGNDQTKVEHETPSNDNTKTPRVNSLSSILRDSTGEPRSSESEPKKSVRFEKMDLIEQYKKYKADNSIETEDDSEVSHLENTLSESEFDTSSNEAAENKPKAQNLDAIESDFEPANSTSRSPTPSPTEKFCNGMMVNVLVRNATPEVNQETSQIDAAPQFVVKKSFVLTIAKQERGFRSLCANKKPDHCSTENLKEDPHISVTFLCSTEPHSEAWLEQGPPGNTTLRLRSLSVPPQAEPNSEVAPSPVPARSRSRERRCKDRQHCKKNHKVKKKDAVFHMPQAVIDELSQVLEKRKPSLDEIAS